MTKKLTYFLLLLIISVCHHSAYSKNKYDKSVEFVSGIDALRNGDIQMAYDLLSAEIIKHPDNNEALLAISTIFHNSGETGKALSFATQALKSTSRRDADIYCIGLKIRSSIYLDAGDTLAALKDINDAIKQIRAPELLNQRGHILSLLKRYKDSDGDFKESIEIKPFSYPPYFGLAKNAMVREEWAKCVEHVNLAIACKPQDSNGYALRANAYIKLEDWSNASDDIIKAISLDKNENAFLLFNLLPQEGRDDMAPKIEYMLTLEPQNNYWYLLSGMIAKENRDFPNALYHLYKSTEIENSALTQRLIVDCEKEFKRYDKALEAVEKAENLENANPLLYYYKAGILNNLARHEEAIEALNIFIAEKPNDPFLYLTRGAYFLNWGKNEEAMEDFKMARLYDSEGEYTALISTKIGDAYRLSGKNEEALREYQSVVEMAKDSTLKEESRLPFALAGTGDFEKAVASMQSLIDTDNANRDENTFNLACLHIRNNDFTTALNILKEMADNGFDEIGILKSDYDLHPLRNEVEFKEIIEKVEKNLKNKHAEADKLLKNF